MTMYDKLVFPEIPEQNLFLICYNFAITLNLQFMIKHKFKARPTTIDDIKFPSKAEGARYARLKTLENLGEVLFFLRQTPFHLPAGIKYVCDFTVFWADGSVTFEDVKGMKTPIYTLKKKQVEALFPVVITEIKV